MPEDSSKILELIKDITQMSCYMMRMQCNKGDILCPQDTNGLYSLLDQYIDELMYFIVCSPKSTHDFNSIYGDILSYDADVLIDDIHSEINRIKEPVYGLSDMASRFLQICHSRLPDDHVGKKWAQNKIMNTLADTLSDLAMETRQKPQGLIRRNIQILDVLKNNKEYQTADVSGAPVVTFYGIEESHLDIALSGIHRLLNENKDKVTLTQRQRKTMANILAQSANHFVSLQNAKKNNGNSDDGYILKFTNAYEKFRKPPQP